MPPVSHIDDLLCVVNVDLLHHPHFSSHVTVIRCKILRCRLSSLSDGMVIFFTLSTSPSFNSARWLVRHCRHLGVTLFTCAELSCRLQLCSTNCSIVLLFRYLDSLLFHHVCRKTCLLSYLSDASQCVTSPFGVLIGPPRPSVVTAPQWVSLPGATG